MKTLETKRNVVSYLASWLGVGESQVLKALKYSPIPDLNLNRLLIPPIPIWEKRVRKILQMINTSLPFLSGNKLSNGLKRLRLYCGRFGNLPNEIPVWDSDWHQAVVLLRTALKDEIGINLRKPAICITHDVDTRECYENIKQLVRLEKEYSCVASFNFLTNWDYSFDPILARGLRDDGFEIGLHGFTHDVAIGYRSRQDIKSHLCRALDRLGIPAAGYRAPAFAVSRLLLDVLQELDFRYDSSALMWRPGSFSVGLSFPYKIPGLRLWEVPVTIEDAMLLKDFCLGQTKAAQFAVDAMEAICALGGVCTINLHPRYITDYRLFFREILAAIRVFSSEAVVTTPSTLVSFFNGDSVLPTSNS